MALSPDLGFELLSPRIYTTETPFSRADEFRIGYNRAQVPPLVTAHEGIEHNSFPSALVRGYAFGRAGKSLALVEGLLGRDYEATFENQGLEIAPYGVIEMWRSLHILETPTVLVCLSEFGNRVLEWGVKQREDGETPNLGIASGILDSMERGLLRPAENRRYFGKPAVVESVEYTALVEQVQVHKEALEIILAEQYRERGYRTYLENGELNPFDVMVRINRAVGGDRVAQAYCLGVAEGMIEAGDPVNARVYRSYAGQK